MGGRPPDPSGSFMCDDAPVRGSIPTAVPSETFPSRPAPSAFLPDGSAGRPPLGLVGPCDLLCRRWLTRCTRETPPLPAVPTPRQGKPPGANATSTSPTRTGTNSASLALCRSEPDRTVTFLLTALSRLFPDKIRHPRLDPQPSRGGLVITSRLGIQFANISTRAPR